MFDIQKTIDIVRRALLEPESAWRSWLEESADWQKTALILTVPLVVTAVVGRYIVGLIFSDPFATAGGLIGILRGIVFMLIGVGVTAGVYAFFAGVFKGKRDFPRALAVVSLCSVPAYAGSVVGPVPFIGWLAALGLAIYGLVLLYRALPMYLEVPDQSRIVHFVVSLLGTALAMLVIGAIFGVQTFAGGAAVRTTGVGSVSSTSESAGLSVQADLVESAMQDIYTPPEDGLLTEDQVERYIEVRRTSAKIAKEHAEKLETRQPEDGEDVNLADLFGSVQDFMGASTAEIRAVKLLDGNWAEHQWVGDQLMRARFAPDAEDTGDRNVALFRKFEDDLAALCQIAGTHMSQDKYEEVGYGSMTIEFGERPALLIVDLQVAFTDPRFPLGRSPMIDAATTRTGVLAEAARKAGIPIAACYTAYDSEKDMPPWKVQAVHDDFYYGHPCTEIDPRVHDADYNFTFCKNAPSIFFQTPLTTFLHKNSVDTVIVTGCTTSGCVRASIVDAFSHGFRVYVPRDCVGDVDERPHEDNLRDVGRRYAEITDCDDCIERLTANGRSRLSATG